MAKLGSTLHRFDSLTSTNDFARELAARGTEEGTIVIARRQTAGRGRQGRRWSSPEGSGLYLSVILRPALSPARSSIIALAAGVAVAETLALDYGLTPDIKWPNDVLSGGRKISGILVESAIEKDLLQYAILGIGVNLMQEEFPEEIRDSATSILIESGRRVAPEDFLKPLLERLERWYRACMSRPEEVRARWEELSSYGRGRRVRIMSGDERVEATTRGLHESGALIIELESGEVREIVSGEITLRPL
ncbi:MAG: biotin--[acetyl-CoA-carboxylase] ligase [Blastocatellia bacterium]|nr:biotin--[acetyl-CoA-carboxylase] ligase [Blastocatellia bacterium]